MSGLSDLSSHSTFLMCNHGIKQICIFIKGEWEKIIAQHSRGLKVEVYHGPTRSSLEENLHLQDIVITSYEVQRYFIYILSMFLLLLAII